MERILVFAPHPDDEIIGCGGYLAFKQKTGKVLIRIIVISDGTLGLLPDQKLQPKLRREECLKGLSVLDVKDIHFWGYDDGSIPLSGDIAASYIQSVIDFSPDIIMLPAPGESHPDHRRVTRGVIRALERKWDGNLWFYETTQPMPFVNTMIDISESIQTKLKALSAHSSQISQYDYLGHCDSLSRMRGIASGKLHSEAFMVFHWDGEPQNFFEARPLISVVIRADDPQILSIALTSLVSQAYDQIEVILVWFGSDLPDLSSFNLLDITIIPGQCNRGYNLNLGIMNARGSYISFLDQDDVLYPEHLALLLAEMQGRPEVDIAYSGCKVVSCRRDEESVEIIKEMETLNRLVETGRLLIGNIIPNHALLFRAQIFRTIHFSESLEAYEDWDLLAQLALADYNFSHVDEVTCEYRLYTDGEPITLDQDHHKKGYAKSENQVLSRIANQLNGAHLKKLSVIIARLEKREKELEVSLNNALQATVELKSRIKEYQSGYDLLNRALPTLNIDKVGKQGLARLIGHNLASSEKLFSIVIPVYNTPPDILTETLSSIIGQSYSGWELCIVDDASTDLGTLHVLDEINDLLINNGNLKFLRKANQGGIVAATNDALSIASSPFIAFVDHDDLLHEDALLEIALAVKKEPTYKLIYTDSTKIDLAGRLLHVYHKPDWSPETLYHLNFINHLTVVKRDLLLQSNYLSQEYEGGQDWDILLRITQKLDESEIMHIRKPLYAWRATEQSLAYSPLAKPGAFDAGIRAVKAALQRKGFKNARCIGNQNGPGVTCEWDYIQRTIEIIIPTHNNLDGLKVCIDGILTKTNYPNIKLSVIANNCFNQEMHTYLEGLVKYYDVNLVIDERNFNWGALNNSVAMNSKADILLFMNDDVEIQNQDWLTSMIRYLEFDGIGVIGATLFYPDGKLQHNGIHTDPLWVADNIRTTGFLGELSVTRNVAAVTGACLLVSRHVFNEIGGFDERLPVNFNDVDFCLAVRNAGYRIIQATDVTLVHHESISRGTANSSEKKSQLKKEINYMQIKWGDFLFDPYWSEYELHAKGTRILHVT